MFRTWLAALAMSMMLVPFGAGAQMAFVAGTDYENISSPVDTGQPDKVVVTEVFWYGCPHCFRFEPYIERWSANLPDGVVFERAGVRARVAAGGQTGRRRQRHGEREAGERAPDHGPASAPASTAPAS